MLDYYTFKYFDENHFTVLIKLETVKQTELYNISTLYIQPFWNCIFRFLCEGITMCNDS